MKPVTSTPESWYMLWNLALVTYVLAVATAVAWWVGPRIIAHGIELYYRGK